MQVANGTELAMPGRHRPVGVGQGHLVARPAPPLPGLGAGEAAGAVRGVGR